MRFTDEYFDLSRPYNHLKVAIGTDVDAKPHHRYCHFEIKTVIDILRK